MPNNSFGPERRERVSHQAWCGKGCVSSRRPVNSAVGRTEIRFADRNLMKTPTSVLTVALVSVLPALFTFLGWVGSILGPRSLIWCGTVGFLGAVASFTLRSKRVYTWPKAQHWATFLSRLEAVLGALCLLSLVILFATSRGDGTAGFPVLAWRPVYELHNFDHRVVVTRLRYVIVGASFFTGWSSSALLLTVAAFRKRFGVA